MALGASLAGVRSMVATSGGGLHPMTEGLSLAGMLELPVVVDLGMGVGPATGMPTGTEQGELQFKIHSGQGEFQNRVGTGGSQANFFLCRRSVSSGRQVSDSGHRSHRKIYE